MYMCTYIQIHVYTCICESFPFSLKAIDYQNQLATCTCTGLYVRTCTCVYTCTYEGFPCLYHVNVCVHVTNQPPVRAFHSAIFSNTHILRLLSPITMLFKSYMTTCTVHVLVPCKCVHCLPAYFQ